MSSQPVPRNRIHFPLHPPNVPLDLEWEIVNIQAHCGYSVCIPPQDMARFGDNVEYRARRGTSVTARVRNPAASAIIFWKSMSMLITGTRTVDDAKKAADKFVAMLQKVRPGTQLTHFRVSNMTAVSEAHLNLHLERLRNQSPYREHITYEPELNHQLVFRIPEPRMTAQISKTGYIRVSGFTDEQALQTGMMLLSVLLPQYQLPPPPALNEVLKAAPVPTYPIPQHRRGPAPPYSVLSIFPAEYTQISQDPAVRQSTPLILHPMPIRQLQFAFLPQFADLIPSVSEWHENVLPFPYAPSEFIDGLDPNYRPYFH